MTTDFRALCAELVKTWDDSVDCGDAVADLVCRARAALAEPQPVPPTNAEIHALADEFLDGDSASRIDFARAVLARWGS